MYMNLLNCVTGVSTLSSGCPTVQVCVVECPTTFYSYYFDTQDRSEEDIKTMMLPYCRTDVNLDQSVQRLIEVGAWR